MAVTSIDHIEIIVHDLEAYVKMFEKLGFNILARTPHHEGSVELQLPGENQPIFEIHQVIGEENPGVNHIAFRAEDVNETYNELKNHPGITFSGPPKFVSHTGRTNANFRDPGGWRFQLVHSERGEWDEE